MLIELLKKQKSSTDYFFDRIDLEKAESILDLFLDCKGTIFFSGVGKSGFVARKIAFTMISTGTKAFFISPTDALHGDLGMVSKEDLFVLMGKSGESEELLQMIPAIKSKGAKTVAFVCKSLSRLSKACDVSMELPHLEELCPYDMAPTNSTAVQLLFGDLLTVALMQKKKFGLDEYAKNHPSGSLGKRMTLRVEDVMIKGKQMPVCRAEDRLCEALVELTDKRCGCLLVEEKGMLKGIFTDGDLRRALQKEGPGLLEKRMGELMTTSPITVFADTLAFDALKIMESDPKKRVTILAVISQEGKLLGLIHLHDILQKGL